MKNEKLLAKLLALVSVPSIFIETVTTADLLINRVSGYEPTEIGTHTKNLLFRKLFYETSNSIPVAYFIIALALAMVLVGVSLSHQSKILRMDLLLVKYLCL